VPDQLLLDGRDGALYDVQQRRGARRRGAAGALLGVGALLSAAFWFEVRRSRRMGPSASGDRFGERAPRVDEPDSTPERLPLAAGGWLLGAALGCILLGLAALAFFGWLTR
jgi:hypothetical protein